MSYLSEVLDNDGKMELLFADPIRDNKLEKVLGAVIRSRHSSRTKYNIVVSFIPVKEEESAEISSTAFYDQIKWACSCKVNIT